MSTHNDKRIRGGHASIAQTNKRQQPVFEVFMPDSTTNPRTFTSQLAAQEYARRVNGKIRTS